MKIALFTCFSPDTGGGAVNLRTLLAQFPGWDVTWFHLGPAVRGYPQCVSLGPPLIGGALGGDLVRAPAYWLGLRRRAEDAIVDRILAAGCDRHWVVAMDEGVRIGLRLTQRAPGVPLHVSIQDDQEYGMYGRSRRYRAMARLVRAPVRRLLRAARTVDVTSDEMAAYYQAQLGLCASVIHPIVTGPVPSPAARAAARDPARLAVGHIGAIYSGREFEAMLAAHRRVAGELGRAPAGCFIGLLPRYRPLVERSGIAADMPARLDEAEAVRRLAQCDFTYAMYPFDGASRVFARTSLPTKLTTYVPAGRPVLAHAPAESTLARTVVRFGLGPVCDRPAGAALEEGIRATLDGKWMPARWATLREAFYGPDNATKLVELLQTGRVR